MASARASWLACVPACALVAGCGEQSPLDPRSDAARQVATLWWWMLGIAGVVLGGALFLLLLGWLRRHREGLPLLGRREGLSTVLVVVFGFVIPLVTNVAVFAVANFAGMPNGSSGSGPSAKGCSAGSRPPITSGSGSCSSSPRWCSSPPAAWRRC
jgi:hypothetical protein